MRRIQKLLKLTLLVSVAKLTSARLLKVLDEGLAVLNLVLAGLEKIRGHLGFSHIEGLVAEVDRDGRGKV